MGALLAVLLAACSDDGANPAPPWMGRALLPGESCESVSLALQTLTLDWLDGRASAAFLASCAVGEAGAPPNVRWREAVADAPAQRDPSRWLGRPLRAGDTCEFVGDAFPASDAYLDGEEDAAIVFTCAEPGGGAPPEVRWREAVAPTSAQRSEYVPWLGRALRSADTCETAAEGLADAFEAWLAGERDTFIAAFCTHGGSDDALPVLRWRETPAFLAETTLPDEIVPWLGRPLRLGETCGGEIGELSREVSDRWLAGAGDRAVTMSCVWVGPNAIPQLRWSLASPP